MLAEYRRRRPNDRRSDHEVLSDLMEHFVKKGALKKDSDGKFILPEHLKGTLDV